MLPDELLRSVSTFAGPRAAANLGATSRTARSIFKPDAFTPFQQADVMKQALRQTQLALEDTVDTLLDPYDVTRVPEQTMEANLAAVSVMLTKFRNAFANEMGNDSWISREGMALYSALVRGSNTRENRQTWRAFVGRVKESFASLVSARMGLLDQSIQQPIAAVFNMARRRSTRRRSVSRKSTRRSVKKRKTSARRKSPKRR